MEYKIQLEEVTHIRPIAVVRRLARPHEFSRIVPETCGLVWNALRQRKMKGGRHIAIYLDSQANLEIGAEVDAPFTAQDEVVASSIPAGPVATTVHFGPYQKLGETHNAIRVWCAQNGHELAGPNWEIYGHWEDAWNRDPSKIRTDVFYLLKPRKEPGIGPSA